MSDGTPLITKIGVGLQAVALIILFVLYFIAAGQRERLTDSSCALGKVFIDATRLQAPNQTTANWLQALENRTAYLRTLESVNCSQFTDDQRTEAIAEIDAIRNAYLQGHPGADQGPTQPNQKVTRGGGDDQSGPNQGGQLPGGQAPPNPPNRIAGTRASRVALRRPLSPPRTRSTRSSTTSAAWSAR